MDASEASTTRSPQTPKQMNREHARRLRYGSPQIQDALRQKCREKMRERRTQLFNTSRYGLEDPPTSEEEWAGGRLCGLMDLGQVFRWKSDSMTEDENWIVEHYLRLMNEDMEEVLRDTVICPICQKGTLEEVFHTANCNNCKVHLPLKGKTLSQFGELFMASADRHSEKCTAVPGFTTISDFDGITFWLVCHTCGLMEIVV